MPVKGSNAGKRWSTEEVRKLISYANKGLSTKEVTRKLQRTTAAICFKASKSGIALMPRDR